MKRIHSLYLTPLALCLALCFATSAMAKPVVFVSIAPQKYFVEQIAGGLVDVKVLVAPGASPHTYEPIPSQMAALAKARAYFAIGVNLEQVWLPRISKTNPSLRIVHTQRDVQKIPMATHAHSEEDTPEDGHDRPHAEEAEDHHDHGTLDPHIWLDPIRVRTIAENTAAGLIKTDPENRETYTANLATFLAELDEMHAAIGKVMNTIPTEHRSFLVFHPSWGYFADRYGLKQMPIETQGREPSPKELAQLVLHAREHGIKVVFIQPQTSQRTAKVISAEIGAQVKVLDPLAQDWKSNLMEAANAFKAALD